jgi:hypothetical protein
MADSTLILFCTHFVRDLSVQCIGKITFGMIRGLELFIDLFMTFVTGMVVKILLRCEGKRKSEEK